MSSHASQPSCSRRFERHGDFLTLVDGGGIAAEISAVNDVMKKDELALLFTLISLQ